MSSRRHLSFMHWLRQLSSPLRNLIHRRRVTKNPSTMTLAPLDDENAHTQTHTVEQWTLDDPKSEGNTTMTVVKVTVYPQAKNNNPENEALNARITHYPPSDRVH